MTNLGKQFHPARDVGDKPPEYSVPPGGAGGVVLHPGGYYPDSEVEDAKRYWKDEGADTDPKVMKEAGALLQPAQGRLFDADAHETMVRGQLGKQRFRTDEESEGGSAAAIRDKTLAASTIPTSHLQPRERGEARQDTQLITHNDGGSWQGSGMGGWYRGPATSERADVLAVNPESPTAFVHEAGHRRHLAETPYYADEVSHPRGINPDPLKEGVADAYVDRYQPHSLNVRTMQEDITESGGLSKFSSYQFTGYSTDKQASTGRNWNADDRALYAATRAHASETGEQALYQPRGRDVREQPGIADYGGGDPTIDATLHGLLSTSPHAAKALRETGLKEEGGRAFRRHRDRELLSQGQSVQGALFHEMVGIDSRKVHGYTPAVDAMGDHLTLDEKFDASAADFDRVEEAHGEPALPVHMSHNQFGEKPRTTTDIGNSLGVSRQHSRPQGFTTFS